MGGPGSGRWKRPGRRTVESCRVLDVNHMLAMGWLQPGWLGTCQLTNGNEVVSIDLRAEVKQLYLSWQFAGAGPAIEGDSEREVAAIEIIPIAYAPCPLGGVRPYFLCPGAGCGRRVLKLYLSRSCFLCRQCGQVVYTSKYERPWQQASRRANKLRQRLGIAGAVVPEKPPGMLVSDYARLLEEMLQSRDAGHQSPYRPAAMAHSPDRKAKA
jgi:hypothetical protein